MKRNGVYFLVLYALLQIVACKNGVSKKEVTNLASATDSIINNPSESAGVEGAKGALLIARNDCLTCHRINEKSIGPSYKAIAAKYHNYEGVIENLSRKIITGGKGLWGDQAMTPHPNLAFNDAAEMARYILSLKENK